MGTSGESLPQRRRLMKYEEKSGRNGERVWG